MTAYSTLTHCRSQHWMNSRFDSASSAQHHYSRPVCFARGWYVCCGLNASGRLHRGKSQNTVNCLRRLARWSPHTCEPSSLLDAAPYHRCATSDEAIGVPVTASAHFTTVDDSSMDDVDAAPDDVMAPDRASTVRHSSMQDAWAQCATDKRAYLTL